MVLSTFDIIGYGIGAIIGSVVLFVALCIVAEVFSASKFIKEWVDDDMIRFLILGVNGSMFIATVLFICGKILLWLSGVA